MLDFFIALFGGAYWIGKYSSYKFEEKRFEENRARYDARRNSLTAQYGASPGLCKKVEEYVSKNISSLIKEYHDDLIYIYGKTFDSDRNNPEIRKNWYYSIRETLKHLILAKEHKKLEHFQFSGYSSGFKPENEPYCVRLFKKMNEYIDNEDCELTLNLFDRRTWPRTMICARFSPAICNTDYGKPDIRI